ncbi:hypothetical protein GCM10007916_08660 [Psychromonas marina]|uniref:Uncharacterized protein n=1 Tax=Psychromonas marina TaxID=88364 RepID=A0ABQ6DXT0_9GAMM|nr:hypothetical protein [Psychromonas marina]GLS89799.1 hypothetical protein GCM10007916_08660 [Psychromonas marina]
MKVLILLGVLFLAIALMVMLVERFAKPADEQQLAKYSKIVPILVFIMLFAMLIREFV